MTVAGISHDADGAGHRGDGFSNGTIRVQSNDLTRLVLSHVYLAVDLGQASGICVTEVSQELCRCRRLAIGVRGKQPDVSRTVGDQDLLPAEGVRERDPTWAKAVRP